MESPQHVNVSRSRTPPSAVWLINRSAYEHLSPQRGIWCSYQLNTNDAHGIPSELSLTTARSRQHLLRRSGHAWPWSAHTSAGTLALVEERDLPTDAWLRDRDWAADIEGAYT